MLKINQIHKGGEIFVFLFSILPPAYKLVRNYQHSSDAHLFMNTYIYVHLHMIEYTSEGRRQTKVVVFSGTDH